MNQIRPNIYQVTFAEIGSPVEHGPLKLENGETLHFDLADMRYAKAHAESGYEPTYFISKSAAMGGDFVVVARQRADRV